MASILGQLNPGRTMRLRTGDPVKAVPALRSFASVEVLDSGERWVTFRHDGEEDEIGDVVRALAICGVPVLGLEEEKADLEDLFLRLTRGEVQ